MNIIHLLTELIPCLLIGYLIGKFNENLSLLIASPLIQFGIPISIMGILLKSGLNGKLIQGALMAWLAIASLAAIIIKSPLIKKNIYGRTLQLGSIFGNTGYFGIPVSLALLPSQALSYSIGFDLGATLIIWSIGPLLLTQETSILQVHSRIVSFFNAIIKSPASKGLFGAIIVNLTPWHEQITSSLWAPSKIVILLALVIIGIRLSQIGDFNESTILLQLKVIQNSLILKLIGFPFVMLFMCLMLRLPSLMRSALVLQAAAPTAISVLLIAEKFSCDKDKATWLVALSTLTALITIPIWALILTL
ncbi:MULTISPECIES: AEC family transporter [Prochlorococcus]|uniref:AEC family transporter n=1 Tax=Prochlorococcus TaxID=1218 RepID=UPI0005338DBD|nr:MULTISPECIES: AEC family transporter [Prochlorococcus]KGG12145.1 Permease [Prochlorococcus sp. MIT 0601]